MLRASPAYVPPLTPQPFSKVGHRYFRPQAGSLNSGEIKYETGNEDTELESSPITTPEALAFPWLVRLSTCQTSVLLTSVGQGRA